MKLIINVPEAMVEDVGKWTIGGRYDMIGVQTAPGRLDLESGAEAEGGSEDDAGDENEAGPTDQAMAPDMTPGSMSDTAGTTIPTTNPAVAALARKKMMA